MYYTRNLLIALLLGSISGCEDFASLNLDKSQPPFNADQQITDVDDNSKYADINLNYTLSEADIDNLKNEESLVGALFSEMTYQGMYNDYQRISNLTHDMYAGYFANNHQNFIQLSPSYKYTDGWSALRWKWFYNDRTTAEYYKLAQIFHFVDPVKYKNAFYILRIYWAYLASVTTDTYGDIPMSAYVKAKPLEQGPNGQPIILYDSQEKCYDMIFKLLEQAVDSIKPGECEFRFAKGKDRCYGGDEEQWLRFANSLRLRLALRLSNIDPQRAQKEGEAAMSNRWGLLQSKNDNFKVVPKYAPVSLGGDDEGGSENVHALCSYVYNGDCVLNKDLELMYKNLSSGGSSYKVFEFPGDPNDNTRPYVQKKIDPRCLISWFRPSMLEALNDGNEFDWVDFNGCESGRTDVAHEATVPNYSLIRTNVADQKVLSDKNWFSYARESVWLSYAEVQFLYAEAALRGWAGTKKSAYEYYKSGIEASFDYYRIDYQDVVDYIANLKDHSFDGGDKEKMLEAIITQKWLAIFPNGNEAWAEFRRTDYPRLTLPLINSSAGDVPEGKFIKRVRYPQNESVLNPNSPKNVKQGDRLWWDVADTNDALGKRVQPNNFR